MSKELRTYSEAQNEVFRNERLIAINAMRGSKAFQNYLLGDTWDLNSLLIVGRGYGCGGTTEAEELEELFSECEIT